MYSPCRMLRVGSCAATLALATLSAGQTAKPQPPSQKFAIPGSPDSASPGRKGPAPADGAKKGQKRGAANPRPRPGAPVATFPGFRMLPNGGSRIYVELTKSVGVDERKANGALVFTLRGAQVLSRNNKNALITTHFQTAVARARLVPAGNDLDLVIDLRKSVDATHQVVAGDNGTARLEIDFPPGDYPPVPGLYEPPAGLRSSGSRDEELPAGEALPPPAPAAPTGTANPGAGPPNP